MQHPSPPLWLDRYPPTPAHTRLWRVGIFLALCIPGSLLAFALYAASDIGIVLSLLVLLFEAVFSLVFAAALWLERGFYQICPVCYHKRRAGYQRCLCGYPER